MSQGSHSIPNDLIIEIFSKLPGKSIAKFRSLSKLWYSTLRGRSYFTELFLTRSLARPRLLFIVQVAKDVWSLYSSPQLQNENSSLVVIADFLMKFHGYLRHTWSYTSGLVLLYIVKKNGNEVHMIFNPITGHYVTLPQTIYYNRSTLGFDPVGKTFKVLVESYHDPKILTLESGKMSWRSSQIDRFFYGHYDEKICINRGIYINEGICINGVCYNLARLYDDGLSSVIVCFDVRSEEFKFIDAECLGDPRKVKLVNYKGRLGGISLEYHANFLELRMYVLEDVGSNPIWSKSVYNLLEKATLHFTDFVVGVTASGEIILWITSAHESAFVHYFNPETNTVQSVEIKGFEENFGVYAYVDLVENLNVNDTKQLKPRWPLWQGLKIIRRNPNSIIKHAPVVVEAVKNNKSTVLKRNKYELLDNLE